MGRESVAGESLVQGIRRRLSWVLRAVWGKRTVRREVQGVSMVMPWSHRLPDYAAAVPEYGQNLIHLARALGGGSHPLRVLDIGANIGDSTLQILDVVDARVLCVEADDIYLPYLSTNVGDDPRVVVERCLLVPDAVGSAAAMTPVRSGGTTRFEVADLPLGVPSVSVAALKERHPGWTDLRLLKSDTDGNDVLLVPAVARVWESSRPVLFFEYDPRLTAMAGHDAQAVWGELEGLGYSHVGVWDNFGTALGLLEIGAVTRHVDELNHPRAGYWDVAVVHESDLQGHAAVSSLMPDQWGTVPSGVREKR